jgi:hypothetical protein
MDSKQMLKKLNTFSKSSESWQDAPVLKPKEKLSSSLLNSPMNLYKIGKEEDESVNIFYNSDEEANTQNFKNVCDKIDIGDQPVRRENRLKSFVHKGKPKEEVKQDKPINFGGSFTIFDFMSRNNNEVVLKEEEEFDLKYLSKNQ